MSSVGHLWENAVARARRAVAMPRYRRYADALRREFREPGMTGVVSQLATEAQIASPTYRSWVEQLKLPSIRHRKYWEYAHCLQALEEHGMLREGRRGLGFGVGKEPLAALMASRGCEIVATDAPTENAVTAGWAGGEEYADGLASLNLRGICEDQAFRARVSFRNVDMNHIPTDLRGFDFCWSSCALEHLGSIEHGLAYIEASLECLVPGGIASHTTEFNLTSNDDTVAQGHTVLFRRRDIEGLVVRLRERGHRIELNLHPGAGPLDEYVDLPPYQQDPHVKLLIRQYVTTSIGLVIQKAS